MQDENPPVVSAADGSRILTRDQIRAHAQKRVRMITSTVNDATSALAEALAPGLQSALEEGNVSVRHLRRPRVVPYTNFLLAMSFGHLPSPSWPRLTMAQVTELAAIPDVLHKGGGSEGVWPKEPLLWHRAPADMFVRHSGSSLDLAALRGQAQVWRGQPSADTGLPIHSSVPTEGVLASIVGPSAPTADAATSVDALGKDIGAGDSSAATAPETATAIAQTRFFIALGGVRTSHSEGRFTDVPNAVPSVEVPSDPMAAFTTPGFHVIVGPTGWGKTTMLRRLKQQLEIDGAPCRSVIVAEPEPLDEHSIMLNPQGFVDMLSSAAPTDVLLVDSLRYFVYSGQGALASGGVNMTMMAELSMLHSQLQARGLTVIATFNPMSNQEAQYNQILQSLIASVTLVVGPVSLASKEPSYWLRATAGRTSGLLSQPGGAASASIGAIQPVTSTVVDVPADFRVIRPLL